MIHWGNARRQSRGFIYPTKGWLSWQQCNTWNVESSDIMKGICLSWNKISFSLCTLSLLSYLRMWYLLTCLIAQNLSPFGLVSFSLFIFRDQWKFTLHHADLLFGAFLSRKIYLAVTAFSNVFDQLVIVYGPVKDTWLSYCRFKILVLGEIYPFRWCVIFHDFIYIAI